MTSLVRCLSSFVYESAFVEPLRRLFLRGPRFLGFWGGIEASELCARLSDVPASFWDAQEEQCRSVVDREVAAFVVGAEAAATAVVLALLLRIAWHRAVVEPAMRRTAAAFAASLPVSSSTFSRRAALPSRHRAPRARSTSPGHRWISMCSDYAEWGEG